MDVLPKAASHKHADLHFTVAGCITASCHIRK